MSRYRMPNDFAAGAIRGLFLVVFVAAGVVRAEDSNGGAVESVQASVKFVNGLRERGYYDLAIDYLEDLRKAKETPGALRDMIDLEEGRAYLEDAARATDPDRQTVQFDRAKKKLETFVKEHPTHPRAAEALVQIAKLLTERGLIAAFDDKKTDARAAFEQARKSYDEAIDRLSKEYERYRGRFFEKTDPRREAQDRSHAILMDAQIARAEVDYQDAITYPAGDPKRNELLEKAGAAFKDLYNKYRNWQAGFYAQMWQAKCLEEKGDLGPAMGIYRQLLEHKDPRLRGIQRQVDFFRIIIYGKRKQYALASDECARWIQANPAESRTDLGLSVRLELAKNLLAQADAGDEAEKAALKRRAIDALTEVARVPSRQKPQALELLSRLKPKAAINANAIANLTPDQALVEAQDSLETKDYARALAVCEAASRKLNPLKDLDKLNKLRYLRLQAAFFGKRYYEAAVLAEHLARRHPRFELAPKAAELGINAYIEGYNNYRQVDWLSDLDRVVDLASYTAETWPETDVGDNARLILGQVALGNRKYEDAAKAFEAVRADSPKRTTAIGQAGIARWLNAQSLRDKPELAKKEADKAFEELSAALKARKEANAPPTDPSLIENACVLAEIDLSRNETKAALDLLDPLARAAGPKPSPILLETILRARVAAGQIDLAVNDMKTLQTLGGSSRNMAQLYYSLGKALERQMEDLAAKGNASALAKTRQDYQTFLEALAASRVGQSFESLQWAAEALLSIDAGDKAEALFERILQTFGDDPAYKKRPGSDKLVRVKTKLAAAQRMQGKFAAAQKTLDPLLKLPVLLPRIEEGLLLEEKASALKQGWELSVDHWKRLAGMLARAGRQKSEEYYDSWYHVAYGQYRLGLKSEARKTLNSVSALSPSLGTPEMKKKYAELLRRIDADLGARSTGRALGP